MASNTPKPWLNSSFTTPWDAEGAIDMESRLMGPHVNVKWFGALGDGSTDDIAAIQAAATSLVPSGGVLFFPPGDYRVSSTIVIPSSASVLGDDLRGIILMGSGAKSTRIRRMADVTVVDICGEHPNLVTTEFVWWAGIRDLEIHGNSTGTSPLVRAFYAKGLDMRGVQFQATGGIGLSCCELHDCFFNDIRFIGCRGNDGASPAFLIQAGTAAASGFGHSADSNNNLYLSNIHFEDYRDGAFWVLQSGPDATGNELIYAKNFKMESIAVRDLHCYLDNVKYSSFRDFFLNTGAYDTGITDKDQMGLSFVDNSVFDNIHFYAAPSIPSSLYLYESVSNCSFGWLTFTYPTNEPTVSYVRIGGTSNTANVWLPSPASFSGWRNQKPAGVPIPWNAGAITDSVMSGMSLPQVDGMMAIDESNNRLYVRVNGTWRYAGLT